MSKALAFAAAVLWAAFFIPAVEARELFCAKDDPSATLKSKFGETPYAGMITHNGLLQIIYLNIEAGSWSIVVRPPNTDLWCFTDSGENWSHFTTETKKKKGLKL